MTDRLHAYLLVLLPLAGLSVLAVLAGCSGPAADGEAPPVSIGDRDRAGGGNPPPVVDRNPEQGDAPKAVTPPVGASGDNPAAVDPGAEPPSREELFAGWPKPKLALVVTGQQHGYIEPCGCTGLANQKGGLARRHSLLKQLESKGWETVVLDAGNQVRRTGEQAEIKLQVTASGLATMNYRAVGLGPDDLRLTPGTLLSIVGAETTPSLFECANAALFADETVARWRVVESAGLKIGVTAVLGSEEQKQITDGDVLLEAPADALRQVWPLLEAQRCDLYVLLAQASLEESRALARQVPHFDLVVTAGGAGEPTLVPEKLEGTDAVMVQTGTKGMYAGVVGVFDEDRLRYQRVPLDDRFQDSPAMLDLLREYQRMLQTRGLSGLGVTPVAHLSGHKFVGSAKCGECHGAEFDVWKETGHSRATDALVHPPERDIPRHFDPECLSCHVTGWNPQKFFPYVSGYLDLDKSSQLHGSGCENCHGPGSAHVAAESGETALDQAGIEQLREGMRLPLDRAEQKCMECHDLDNSPDFHQVGAFAEYWEKVKH